VFFLFLKGGHRGAFQNSTAGLFKNSAAGKQKLPEAKTVGGK
jgi:hypothetical protein